MAPIGCKKIESHDLLRVDVSRCNCATRRWSPLYIIGTGRKPRREKVNRTDVFTSTVAPAFVCAAINRFSSCSFLPFCFLNGRLNIKDVTALYLNTLYVRKGRTRVLDDRDGPHHWLLDSETQDTLPEQIVGSGKSVLWFGISHHLSRVDESY
jgi:hypothetical protein